MKIERPHQTDIQRGDTFAFWDLYDPRRDNMEAYYAQSEDERRKPIPLVVLSISITGAVCVRRNDMLDRDGHHPLLSIPLSDVRNMIDIGVLELTGNVDPFILVGKQEEDA